MRRSAFRWRLVAALSLIAMTVGVTGCQQTAQLPPRPDGTKPASQEGAPAAARVAALPLPPPPPAPSAPLPAAPPPVVPAPAPAAPPGPTAAVLPIPAPAARQPGQPRFEARAALLLPLSGPQAVTGQVLANAAQLALFEIADSRFSLLPLDTRGSAEGAAAAVQQALAQGADIILGPLFSFEVKAAAPPAREHGIPMLAFTTDRSAAGAGIYTMGFLPGPQVARILGHARDQGLRRLGVLARSDEYGRAMAETARDTVAALGMELAALEYYDPAATDFTATVRRFVARKGAGFDAVLIPDDGVRLRNIASLLSYFLSEGAGPGYVPPRLLGTLLWDDPRLATEPALAGGWYPAPPAAGHREFEQRYVKAFGALPPRSGGVAGLAYDAAALAAALARNGLGEYAGATLQNPNGFAGVDGIFRLLPSGEADRGLTVREIAPGGSREISPAPAAFDVGR